MLDCFGFQFCTLIRHDSYSRKPDYKFYRHSRIRFLSHKSDKGMTFYNSDRNRSYCNIPCLVLVHSACDKRLLRRQRKLHLAAFPFSHFTIEITANSPSSSFKTIYRTRATSLNLNIVTNNYTTAPAGLIFVFRLFI